MLVSIAWKPLFMILAILMNLSMINNQSIEDGRSIFISSKNDFFSHAGLSSNENGVSIMYWSKKP